ncbi:hypothetical protein BD410DRAFT_770650 [Rickenella mellea]|uniref:B30.2/SPRY domain-containing protein n=1 Tax=Rickenella mellea TaxID=50990 RepID=A0A4Y7Q5E2_9AGAM|nr:hypothetical protein BD410DRAFT_770650 [Rickenella mellea]
MNWIKHKISSSSSSSSGAPSSEALPAWAPAAGESLKDGKFSDAPEYEYREAEKWCRRVPVASAAPIPAYLIDRINAEGCKAWDIVQPSPHSRFRGFIQNIQGHKEGGPKVVHVHSAKDCGDYCLMSNLPLMAGMYGIQGKEGVYYEVQVRQMQGTIAIGMSCQPYPEYRLPGWNRRSAALHLDDLQIFYEDSDGGKAYDKRLKRIKEGDVIGCGYEFSTTSLFFTHNGERLDTAFVGPFAPREHFDVYAAIGMGKPEMRPGENDIIVNFGGDDQDHLFRWKPGREWAWLVDGHVGRNLGSAMEPSGSGIPGDRLPTYAETKNM